MTPAELDRLDRLMAEKCMGWEEVYNTVLRLYLWRGPEGMGIRVDHWHPSREIAQAFQCLEKMHGDGFNVSLVADNGWGCTLFKTGLYGDHGWIESHGPINADAASEAIVLSIEKWLEGKK